MIFRNYLLGFIEDNAGIFVIPRLIRGLAGCTDYVGYPTGICQNLLESNEPFAFIPAYLLAKLIDPVLSYNLIMIGGLVLNFVFAFRFSRKLFGGFIALILSAIFLFNPYFAYQSRAHFDLIQFWPVIWFLDTLLFSKDKYKAVYLGLLITLITGFSNYLGYFTITFSTLYMATDTLMKLTKKTCPTLNQVRSVVITTLVFALSSGVFLFPYIKSNFFTPRIRMETNADLKATNRPIEDFVIFSSRPWYYLLPSVDNPFFGEFSERLLKRLSDGGNYLTQSYFKAEHAASYIGWVNLLAALVGLSFLKKVKQGHLSYTNSLSILLSCAGLIILTMPPELSFRDSTFYTPSYLLFKVFPMFRVLTRAGVLILFLTLIFSGYGYKILISFLLGKGFRKRYAYIVTIFLLVLSVMEFYIPIKVTRVGTPPKVYTYLSKGRLIKSPIAVYPYNKTNESLFWMGVHQQPLINPKLYSNRDAGFTSENFTSLLTTPQGLEKAKVTGARYLVYFYEEDKYISSDFFSQTSYLAKVDKFQEKGPGEKQIDSLIRIVEAGSTKSNSAILYEFR